MENITGKAGIKAARPDSTVTNYPLQLKQGHGQNSRIGQECSSIDRQGTN